VVLDRQRDGMCGNLTEISAWLQKDGNAWLSKDGEGKYGWEEVPYWLRGFIELAYVTNDPKLIAESQVWIDGCSGASATMAISARTSSGKMAPAISGRTCSCLFALQSYHEYSNDPRVLQLMTKYFQFQHDLPDDKFFCHPVAGPFVGVNIWYGVYWLYNRTGDAFLLDLATRIDHVMINWRQKGNLPRWHNVDIAECFREPATYYLQSKKPEDLQCSYDNFSEVRQRYRSGARRNVCGDENLPARIQRSAAMHRDLPARSSRCSRTRS